MSDAKSVTPLQGAKFDGIATVQEIGPRGMITLRGDLSDATFAAAVEAVTGCTVPAQRKASLAGGNAVLWMTPDELMLMLPAGSVAGALETLADKLAGVHHLAADVSDARALFRLSAPGTAAREVLARLAPVDLAPGQFGPGDLRRTRVGQVAAAFVMVEEGVFELVCFRSVARYVFDLLADACGETTAQPVF
ncbi:sarcosine oxidase subunit gamma [Maritimibacter alkaliphilus]|uniref:sarcosine oxidase subunit gamma n=1 Tax=Maritimibacter alkaliphilus TaxID=404236 RepID=UPI001C96045D|nr:sarcosine oxidase subunit gamma family protein [Maritimibacter alkaliphilus]MBY6089756.1 sarcosine oxidase subunit gamma [Maritimibacter alkaliphilus]